MADDLPDYRSVKAQWDKAKWLKEKEDLAAGAGQGQVDKVDNKQRRLAFKASHGLLLAFFTWIISLHALGLYFFTKGFLLTRFVLDHKSECAVLPFESEGSAQNSAAPSNSGCWHAKTFDKAVVIIVDALRYDFTVPYNVSNPGQSPDLCHDALPFFYETALKQPENAFLLPFIADPPTTTLVRLKGLTTGTLPAFVDAGSNFAGTAIEEDNLLAQLKSAGKNMVHLGDDTWHALFPGYFDANLTHKYDSFNVWDLHTVDDGVTEHLLPLLQPSNTSKWDVLIGHYLGVDHAGHRYGPNHTAMTSKLQQMDGLFRQVTELLDDATLLVVMGDHGMDAKGDHGGESYDEVQAALWMYSKKGIFGRSLPEFSTPPSTARERPVGQVDLVPTLSLLLGLPIPFNSLGAPIEEAFIGRAGQDWRNLATVSRLAAAQVKRYQREYALARGIESSTTAKPLALWEQATEAWSQTTAKSRRAADQTWRESYRRFEEYQKETLDMCKRLWTMFDVPSMYQGIVILAAGVVILIAFGRGLAGDASELCPVPLVRIAIGTVLGVTAGLAFATAVPSSISPLDGALLGSATGGILGGGSAIVSLRPRIHSVMPHNLWGWLAVLFTVSQSIGFASNSYTIWEDEILLFFVSTFGILAMVSSLRQPDRTDRVLGCYQSVLFVVLTRVISLSRLCREEQMPFCRSTYYASANSSTSATWQLFLPLGAALLLPDIVTSYYKSTRSYEGPAVFWIGTAFRTGLVATAIFWTLDAADDGDWVAVNKDVLKTVRMSLAQLVLGLGLAAGTAFFLYAKPCVSIHRTQAPAASDPPQNSKPTPSTATPTTSITILGYANTHGTHYLLLLLSLALSLLLLQKPMGQLSLSLLLFQTLSLLEILTTSSLSASAIGPTLLAMLGNYHFFKTGHQATLASIQWETAFIPLRSIAYPWSPLLVVGNTFGAQILTAAAVPLVVLWKRPPRRAGVLGELAKAVAAFLAYHATVALATTMWAGWLRRHLMLYRIFAPRWMVGGGVLLVVDVVVVVVALGVGVGATEERVGEVFGWA